MTPWRTWQERRSRRLYRREQIRAAARRAEAQRRDMAARLAEPDDVTDHGRTSR